MKIFKILSLSLLFLCANLVYAQEKIIFATHTGYPPFVSKNAQGDIIGFGADIVHAICKKLNASCTIEDTSFEALIPSLNSNKYDVAFGGMSITKKREKVVDFTQSYLDNIGTFLIKKNHKLTLTKAGLEGKTVGYQQGTTFKNYLSGVYGNSIKVKSYPNVEMGLIDLESGRIDTIVMDKTVAKQLIKNSKNINLTTQGNLVSTKYFGIGKGMAVKKGNTKLLNQLNTTISELKQDGTLQKITNKWF